MTIRVYRNKGDGKLYHIEPIMPDDLSGYWWEATPWKWFGMCIQLHNTAEIDMAFEPVLLEE